MVKMVIIIGLMYFLAIIGAKVFNLSKEKTWIALLAGVVSWLLSKSL